MTPDTEQIQSASRPITSREEELPQLVLKFANTTDRYEFFNFMVDGVGGIRRGPDDKPAWRFIESWGLGEGQR